MVDQQKISALRVPTEENPLRILVSGCLIGIKCGINGDNYGEYPSVLKLLNYKNVQLIPFCPEDFSFGTPREMCDIYGGDGFDVLSGKAKVLTSSGVDWSEGMIKASEKMLEVARKNDVELALLMDISAACGNHVIYDGNRYSDDKKYQIGMGVCGAQLARNGYTILSWREFASLEIVYSKIDPTHQKDETAIDFQNNDWYKKYFNK